MKKTLISALLLALSATAAWAGHSTAPLSAKDTITDNNIIFPASFDTDTKDLMTNWYLQRYAVIDSLATQEYQAVTSDQEYINRLQKLPTVIEMPFNSVVKQFIEMYALRRQPLIQKMLGLSIYYMPIFEDALSRLELPQELKYLPIIESALNPKAISKAGAAGLWQFMPSTATGKGLEVNSLVDERLDPLRSSHAAASLLKEFYDIYGDWALALAAYNCGPGNVNKAIRNSGGRRDFWEIYNYLPKETRGYVPAFIAATYIMNNYGKHGITPVTARSPIVTDTVHITNRVHFKQISDVMGISVDELRTLNPQYKQDIIPGNIKPYTLILPSVQAYCYKANEDSILSHNRNLYEQRAVVEPSTGISKSQSELEADANARNSAVTGTDSKGAYTDELVVKYHTVQRGETLKSIANLYGVTVEDIRTANDLSSTKIKRGKKLKINTYNRTYLAENQSPVQQPAASVTPSSNQPVAPQASAAAPSTRANNNTTRNNTRSTTKNTNKTNTPKTTTPRSTSYTVKSGDNLDKIARRNGVSVDQLMKQNGLTSDKIKPGQTLKIPGKTTSKKTTTGKSSSKKTSSAQSSSRQKKSSKSTKSRRRR